MDTAAAIFVSTFLVLTVLVVLGLLVWAAKKDGEPTLKGGQRCICLSPSIRKAPSLAELDELPARDAVPAPAPHG